MGHGHAVLRLKVKVNKATKLRDEMHYDSGDKQSSSRHIENVYVNVKVQGNALLAVSVRYRVITHNSRRESVGSNSVRVQATVTLTFDLKMT